MSAVAALPDPEAERRTVEVELGGRFKGLRCVARADFRTRTLVDLSSEDLSVVIAAMDRVVLEHNFPDAEEGGIATSLFDVDPKVLTAAITGIFDAIGQLPKD